MLIEEIYFSGAVLVLRDVDGSKVTMPLADAQQLLIWLLGHNDELRDRIADAERIQEAITRDQARELARNEEEYD